MQPSVPATAPAAEAAKPETPATEPAKSDAAKSDAGSTVTVSTPSAPVVDPIIEAARRRLADKSFGGKSDLDDLAALAQYYGGQAAPLWIKDGAFNPKATALIAELKKADDWGLEASAFALPDLASGATPDAQGEAEAKLSLVALKYARFARGGRTDPVSMSNILDMKPPVKDPKAVMTELAASTEPDAYLRDLHPKHEGFKALRQALLKTRAPEPPSDDKIDEALKVKIPLEGNNLKAGNQHADIALLRKRLKIDADEGASEFLFDPKLEAALKAFQISHELKDTGVLNSKTRAALNREGEPKKVVSGKDKINLILANMERWRWLPEDLGGFYVMNNIPEFTSRVMKNGNEALKQRIIVGQPTWPTPVIAAQMQYVIFHPEWGVPDGIKVKELLPRLRKASSQYSGGFLDEIFGGGGASGGGARVLAAYKLNPTLNGRPVDANKVDWNRVDIKQFQFVQPAGGENPLGLVKFRFPNRHDVYMHDTPQRGLFAQSFRALSHGCMRVEQPRKLAEIILGEDRGWSTDKVGGMLSGADSVNEVSLSKPVPVYVVYFTAQADASGKLETFSDIYGHDDKLLSALAGKPVHYSPPDHSKEDFVAAGEAGEPVGVSTQRGGKKQAAQPVYVKKSKGDTVGDLIGNAFQGLLAN